MSDDSAAYQIHSAARGPHWIAWVSRPGTTQPERAVVLVGETREEAETRAREWMPALYPASLHKI